MARYSVGVSKAGVNAVNTVMWQIRCPTGADRLRVREVLLTVDTAPTTAPQFVLARSTAIGTSSTATAGQQTDPADAAALSFLDSAWSSAPTFATAGPFLKRATLPVTAGSGILWAWPADAPLIVPVNAGLVVANLVAAGATVGAFTCTVDWDE